MNNQTPPCPPQNPYPPQNGYNPQTPQEPPTKKGNGLIIAVIIAGLLLIGGGVAAFFLLRNKSAANTDADAKTELLTNDDKSGNTGQGETADSLTKDAGNGEGVDTDRGDEITGKGVDDELNGEENSSVTETPTGDDNETRQIKQRLQRFQYSLYQNQRFGYSMNVPDFMAPGPEGENGDGRSFYYNGITLSAYASHNALEYDVDMQMDFQDPDRKAQRRRVGSNAFILSGKGDDGSLYVMKQVLKNEVWYTSRLEYPAKFKDVIAPLSQIVTNFEP